MFYALNRFLFPAVTLSFLVGLFIPLSLFAQERRPELTGEISFEQERRTSAYGEIQDNTIAAFEEMVAHAQRYAQGAAAAPAPRLGTEELNFLTGVYLHCTVQRGTCPALLEAMLEFDLTYAVESKDKSCPALKTFWRRWLDNDMENRHRYLVRTGHMQTSFEFNQSVRPRFIRCERTVEEILSSAAGLPGQELLKRRYQPGSESRRSLEETVRYLKEIRSTVPNIFAVTGS